VNCPHTSCAHVKAIALWVWKPHRVVRVHKRTVTLRANVTEQWARSSADRREKGAEHLAVIEVVRGEVQKRGRLWAYLGDGAVEPCKELSPWEGREEKERNVKVLVRKCSINLFSRFFHLSLTVLVRYRPLAPARYSGYRTYVPRTTCECSASFLIWKGQVRDVSSGAQT